MGVTDDCLVRLAEACPKLRNIEIPSTGPDVTDKTLIAFCQNCPDLDTLDLAGCAGQVTGTFFAALADHPEWAPRLTVVRVYGFSLGALRGKYTDKQGRDKQFMEELDRLSMCRPMLIVHIIFAQEHEKDGIPTLRWYVFLYKDGELSGPSLFSALHRGPTLPPWDECPGLGAPFDA